ncbi:helix-turn-helix transcriptional regulator [Pseudomonas shirazensis]
MKKKLIKKRLEKGLSQEQLADLIGMTQSNYSRRENGLKKITDQEWLKIAKELGVKKEDIYQEDTLKLDQNEINLQEYSIPDAVLLYIESLKKENSALKERKEK